MDSCPVLSTRLKVRSCLQIFSKLFLFLKHKLIFPFLVTARRPPNLPDSVKAKSTVRRFKTPDSVPSGPPQNLKVTGRFDNKLAYAWEPPECAEQNGPISQYEYKITGLDDWNQGTRQEVASRTKTDVGELMPGSLYRFEVRAYTSEGPGPVTNFFSNFY